MKKIMMLLLCAMLSFQVKATNMENIKVVIPYAPGSGFDQVFRILQAYGLKHKINFIPEFKPGANGLIGAEYFTTQPKDGKSLMLTGTSDLTYPYPVKHVDYTDFTPVTALVSAHMYLVANKNVPANNLTELVNMLKNNSQSVSISAPSHKQSIVLKQTLSSRGVKEEELLIVQFTGMQAITAMIGGHVDVGLFPGIMIKSSIDSDNVKILASLNENKTIDNNRKLESLQGPAIGVDGISIFLPRGVDSTKVKRWQDFIDNFKQDADVQKSLADRYFQLFKGKGSKELDEMIKNQLNSSNKFSLTFRQHEIARLIINRGLTNEQIADTLNLSEATVKLHAGLVYKKVGVKNRVQLVAISKNNFG
jgi:tripartite-type tricarboxylate transporter receptor subunit TctC